MLKFRQKVFAPPNGAMLLGTKKTYPEICDFFGITQTLRITSNMKWRLNAVAASEVKSLVRVAKYQPNNCEEKFQGKLQSNFLNYLLKE